MGSPIVTTDGVFFTSAYPADPMDFVVDSSNPQIATDERWVISTVQKPAVNAGQALNVNGSNPVGAAPIPFVRVFETGTYVSDNPTADFIRNQNIAITIFDPFGFVFPTNLDITFNPDGTWFAKAEVDLLAATFGAGAKTFQIDLTNVLELSPLAPANASITKTSSLIIIPEPATLLLGLLAVPAILRRRSRA